jgi:pimeloyl-ACP methyl ester carboxylesterase
VLECEDLREVHLVGHSYGGMVATGVADRAADRIARVIYLDAFVPRDGQSLLDLGSPTALKTLPPREWKVPPNPLPPDTSATDAAWIMPRRFAHPRKCLEQGVRLSGAVEKLPRTYVYCTRPAPGDGFRQFAERAKKEGWQSLEIDASHNPHITNPGALARLLDRVATERWPTPLKTSAP